MENQKIPILLNCLAAFLGAFGQYYYKKGSALLHQHIFNVPIIIGILLFCGVMGLFVLTYKFGGKISVVYPFYATTFVWGTLIGIIFEKEPVKAGHFVGLSLLLVGLAVIAFQAE
jgi:multidrug transporter EmrE-like cation transporter